MHNRQRGPDTPALLATYNALSDDNATKVPLGIVVIAFPDRFLKYRFDPARMSHTSSA